MSRESAWRSQCPEIVRCRQLQALYGPTLFLVRRPGPLSLVIRATAAAKPIKVRLSGRHWCSCKAFSSENELCVHLCWALLRLFRLSPTNPLSFQLGMVEREISSILKTALPLSGPITRAAILQQRLPTQSEISQILPNIESESNLIKPPAVASRPLTKQDCCPICLEPLLQKPFPVTHCRYSCGNQVHIRCMQIWIKHNSQDDSSVSKFLSTIKCPVCRGVFNYESDLKREFQNAPRARTKRPPVTLPPLPPATPTTQQQQEDGVMALLDSLLASQHNQEVRNERSASSEGITNSSEAASSTSTTGRIREIITPVAVSVLVRALPEWKIPPRHRLLAPGHQCCLCLSHYEAGETVSGLQCGHEFHADCLKPWLQRNSARSRGARCPIDHMDLTPWLTERLISLQRTASREPPPAGKSSIPPSPDQNFSLRSSRLTLINRLHVGLHSHSCGHLPTPPPSTCSSPPPPPAPSSETSRPASGGRKGRLAAQQSAAVLHLVSLNLPIGAEETTSGGGMAGGRRKHMEPRQARFHWAREAVPHLEIACRKISLKAKS